MDILLGNLSFQSVLDHPEMVAPSVAAMLLSMSNTEGVGVVEIDPDVSDTAGFCERYGVKAEESANCVIVEGKRGEERQLAACVILASTRADVNGAVRGFLEARKVSFASMDKAVEESKMEFGAITPVGLPAEWPILIDAAVAKAPYVIIGSGVRTSKLAVPGSFLASLPNAIVIEGLAQPRV